ncbi:Cysteine and histidine-rich domain-containing 1 protein [Rutstroemia sp. NJR-2017a BBW]|nr:Cysteine and histidine-rich domain-containing 1 protein [Rutstroemia sp. NJR-2017a BBW]
MPGLTVSTTSPSSNNAPTHSPHSTSSRSASPVRPPYSPITPTLSPQRLVQFSHTQDPQVSVPQPKVEKITLDENPDVLAMRSTISILQLQARKAERDMRALQRIKERALGDPEGFVRSLRGGEVRSEGMGVGEERGVESSSEEEDEEGDEMRGNGNDAMEDVKTEEKWEEIPKPQNIVRCPPINWAKYGVVGESLDKMHEDQVRRPSEGFPAKINPDGTVTHVYGDGPKREYNLTKPLGVNEVVSKSKKKK